MKKVVVSIVSAAALATVGMAAASDSMAATSVNPSAKGIFISGNLGYGSIDRSKTYYNSPSGLTPSKYQNGYFAWMANVGYQFNRYIAIEAGYISFGQAKANAFMDNSTAYTITDAFGGFDAALKGILPINSQFDVFAKAGAVRMHDSQTVTNGVLGNNPGTVWTPMLGVGTSYNLNSHVALTVQDVYAFKKNYTHSGSSLTMPAANAILAGASYKFNM